MATPKGYDAPSDVVEAAKKDARMAGTQLMFTHRPEEAVLGCDVIVTDTWVSMGMEKEKAQRMKDFHGYQVTMKLASHAKPGWKFLHCLPRKPEEVDDEVFYSNHSLVWDEAENRMWTVMVRCGGRGWRGNDADAGSGEKRPSRTVRCRRAAFPPSSVVRRLVSLVPPTLVCRSASVPQFCPVQAVTLAQLEGGMDL